MGRTLHRCVSSPISRLEDQTLTYECGRAPFFERLSSSQVGFIQLLRIAGAGEEGTDVLGLVVEELPIRLAHRVKELDELPHNLNKMPSIEKVKRWYVESFEVRLSLPRAFARELIHCLQGTRQLP